MLSGRGGSSTGVVVVDFLRVFLVALLMLFASVEIRSYRNVLCSLSRVCSTDCFPSEYGGNWNIFYAGSSFS